MEGGGGEAGRGTKHRDGNADCENNAASDCDTLGSTPKNTVRRKRKEEKGGGRR